MASTDAISTNDTTLLKWLLNATNPTTRWAGERIKQLKAELAACKKAKRKEKRSNAALPAPPVTAKASR